jgi:hypothetical protein
MTIAIGSASWLPATPTRGATSAPKPNWPRPSRAEAAPSDPVWDAIAEAVPLGRTTPLAHSSTKKHASSGHRPAWATVTTSAAIEATAVPTSPRRSSHAEPRRPTARLPSSDSVISPPELTAKMTLNSCGEILKMFSSTYDEPEM